MPFLTLFVFHDNSSMTGFIILAGIFGILIGSFLNVVILRSGTKRGFLGRSHCFSCNRTLHARDLIPVISFLIHKGRCRMCNSRISTQYPVIELITGILFASGAWVLASLEISGWVLVFSLMMWWIWSALAIVLAVYDWRHKMVLSEGLVVLCAWSVIAGLFINRSSDVFVMAQGWFGGFDGALLGILLVPAPFFLMWYFSQGRLIGFGDIEYMALIGFVFGISGGFSIVLYAFWLGALAVLIGSGLLLIHNLFFKVKKRTLSSEVPFLPFLLIATYGYMLTGYTVIDLADMIMSLNFLS